MKLSLELNMVVRKNNSTGVESMILSFMVGNNGGNSTSLVIKPHTQTSTHTLMATELTAFSTFAASCSTLQ